MVISNIILNLGYIITEIYNPSFFMITNTTTYIIKTLNNTRYRSKN
jgi:hypothetical protein